MIAIDTNILVRLVVTDHVAQTQQAKALLQSETVFIPSTVLLEAAWVLGDAYGHSSADIVTALQAVVGLPNVSVERADSMQQLFDLVGERIDFADALHLIASAGSEAFVTFDRRLISRASGKAKLPVRAP